MGKRTLAAVVAMDEHRVIGKDGSLPWHLPEDLAHFKALTTGHVVIMGRKTWNSLPPRFRPLPGRTNIVVSRSPATLNVPEGTIVAGSLDEATKAADLVCRSDQRVWLIGGAEIYAAGLPLCDEVHLTLVRGAHEGDATFPQFEDRFVEVSAIQGERCVFKVYRKK